MKRYLAFSGESYYPAGGAEDLRGDSDDPDEAEKEARAAHKYGPPDWWHVLDTETGEIVRSYWPPDVSSSHDPEVP